MIYSLICPNSPRSIRSRQFKRPEQFKFGIGGATIGVLGSSPLILDRCSHVIGIPWTICWRPAGETKPSESGICKACRISRTLSVSMTLQNRGERRGMYHDGHLYSSVAFTMNQSISLSFKRWMNSNGRVIKTTSSKRLPNERLTCRYNRLRSPHSLETKSPQSAGVHLSGWLRYSRAFPSLQVLSSTSLRMSFTFVSSPS